MTFFGLYLDFIGDWTISAWICSWFTFFNKFFSSLYGWIQFNIYIHFLSDFSAFTIFYNWIKPFLLFLGLDPKGDVLSIKKTIILTMNDKFRVLLGYIVVFFELLYKWKNDLRFFSISTFFTMWFLTIL